MVLKSNKNNCISKQGLKLLVTLALLWIACIAAAAVIFSSYRGKVYSYFVQDFVVCKFVQTLKSGCSCSRACCGLHLKAENLDKASVRKFVILLGYKQSCIVCFTSFNLVEFRVQTLCDPSGDRTLGPFIKYWHPSPQMM